MGFLNEQVLNRIAFFSEVLIFAWLSKVLAAIILRRNFNKDLTERDNPAAAIFISSFYLSVFLALSHILGAPGKEFVQDLLEIGKHSSIVIILLFVAMFFWLPFYRIRVNQDIFEGKNSAAALVGAANSISTAMIYGGSISGDGADILVTLAFFGIGQIALFVMGLLYQWITPHDIYSEVRDKKNLACGFGFAGAIISFGIIIGNAAKGDFETWEKSVREFLLFCIPLLAIFPVRELVARAMFLGWRDIDKEITEDRNVAVGLIEASCYIGIALFVVSVL